MVGDMTIPAATPHGAIRTEDVTAVMALLSPDLTYLSRDLYQAYEQIVRHDGRNPASKVEFGRALGRAGMVGTKAGGLQAWRTRS
jgi:hypothetical protein